MKTNPAHAPLHLDVYADPAEFVGPTVTTTPHLDRARFLVMANRVEALNAALGWWVQGDDQRALHVMNLMLDEELAIAAYAGERLSSMAAEILGARRALGDEIGGLVIGAGRRRAL